MAVSEEGTQHSDYLFRRDKQLKDGYQMSQKNFRIVPEISKQKHKLTDKEQNISAKIVAEDNSKQEETTKHEIPNTPEEAISSKAAEVKTTLDDMHVTIQDHRNEGGAFEVYLESQGTKNLIYPLKNEQDRNETQNSSTSITHIILLIIIVCAFFYVFSRFQTSRHTARKENI